MFPQNCPAIAKGKCAQKPMYQVNVRGEVFCLCYYHAKMAGYFHDSSIQPIYSTRIGSLHVQGMSGS